MPKTTINHDEPISTARIVPFQFRVLFTHQINLASRTAVRSSRFRPGVLNGWTGGRWVGSLVDWWSDSWLVRLVGGLADNG